MVNNGFRLAILFCPILSDSQILKLYVPITNIFFFGPEKTELDYDMGIFMRLWNVKNVAIAVLSTIIQL
jgi:hypothetical protein